MVYPFRLQIMKGDRHFFSISLTEAEKWILRQIGFLVISVVYFYYMIFYDVI